MTSPTFLTGIDPNKYRYELGFITKLIDQYRGEIQKEHERTKSHMKEESDK